MDLPTENRVPCGWARYLENGHSGFQNTFKAFASEPGQQLSNSPVLLTLLYKSSASSPNKQICVLLLSLPTLVCLPEMPFNPSLSSPLDLSNLLIFPGPNQIAAMLILLQQYLPPFFTPWHTEHMVFVWHAGVKEQSYLLQKRRAEGSDRPRPLLSAPMPRAIKPSEALYTNFHSCTCHIHTKRLIVLLVPPAKP